MQVLQILNVFVKFNNLFTNNRILKNKYEIYLKIILKKKKDYSSLIAQ